MIAGRFRLSTVVLTVFFVATLVLYLYVRPASVAPAGTNTPVVTRTGSPEPTSTTPQRTRTPSASVPGSPPTATPTPTGSEATGSSGPTGDSGTPLTLPPSGPSSP